MIHMQLRGPEALCLLLLSPALMALTSVRSFVMSPFGLMVVRMMVLVGVASFLTGLAVVRIIMMSVGSSCGMLALAGSLWGKQAEER